MDNSLQTKFDIVEEKGANPKFGIGTVVDTPDVGQRFVPISPIVMNIATQADGFIPWGQRLKARDAQLRSFWPTEPLLASAVYSMSTRTAVLGWEIVNSDLNKPRQKNTIAAVTRMLKNSDRGNGWEIFMIKLLTDLYTQDNGAFIELLRNEDRPDSPVVSIAHLDSFSCYRTGDPEYPVIYRDRLGAEHVFAWWNIQTVEEMPSPVELMYGAQTSAITRCLLAAQIIRDVSVYKKEKISGQFARALHFVSGVTRQNIEDGLALSQEQTLNQGLVRYIQPSVIPTLDPDANLNHVQIDLAALPDGFNEDQTLQWYITQLAVAFGVDYQEFAPLARGSIGSGQQSETLHLKSRGKGPALVISLMEHILNDTGIVPSNVHFQFLVTDAQADEARANARFLRGKDRALRVSAGELDVESSRKLAKEDGDLPEWLLEEMLNKPALPPPAPKPAAFGQPAGGNPNPQQQTSISNDQTQGGINSRAGRKAFEDDNLRSEIIRRLMERGDIVQDKQIDPSGYIYLDLGNDAQVTDLLREYQTVMDDPGIEWQAVSTFHITLAYAPQVQYSQLLEATQEIHMSQPIPVDFDGIDLFDSGDVRALVMRVKPNQQLKDVQSQVYNVLSSMNISLSPYSTPDVWKPHITLAYLPSGVEVPDVLFPLYRTITADKIVVGRGDYETFATITSPKMGGEY